MTLHAKLVLSGTFCLAALAWLLWEPDTSDPDHEATANWGTWGCEKDDAQPAVTRVTAFNMGRTTIEPLVSPEYLARRNVS